MTLNVRIIMHTVNYIAFCITLFAVSLLSFQARFLLLLLSFGFLSNYTLHTFLLYEKQAACLFSSLADLVVVGVIMAMDPSGASLFLGLFLIGDAILDLHAQSATLLVCVDFGICVTKLFNVLHGRMVWFLPCLLLCAAAFVLFSLIFMLIKRLRMQNERLESALRDSMVEKVQAQARRRELEAAYKQAVQASAADARNRIAREIHDTVGHTLTTVLVELEASRRLIGRDSSRAMEKLTLAQEQVRTGLHAIRASVRILEEDKSLLDPLNAMETLLQDCAAHTGITVTCRIDRNIPLSKQAGDILYACLREGLTNSLRHGQSTAVECALVREENGLRFSLSDNGAGATAVSPGFGIRAMQSRVEQANGSLRIQTEKGKGFSIRIWLPAFAS